MRSIEQQPVLVLDVEKQLNADRFGEGTLMIGCTEMPEGIYGSVILLLKYTRTQQQDGRDKQQLKTVQKYHDLGGVTLRLK